VKKQIGIKRIDSCGYRKMGAVTCSAFRGIPTKYITVIFIGVFLIYKGNTKKSELICRI